MLLSVVLTNLNEGATIVEFISRCAGALNKLKQDFDIDGEMIFVDDHSKDFSPHLIKEAIQNDKRVRLLQMTRQMGRDICFFAGLKVAKGDLVITMDSDLQDPPELFEELVKLWKSTQADVVNTHMVERHGETLYKRFMLKLSYRILAKSYPFKYSVDCGNFKLLTRRAVNEILKSGEVDPYFRAYTDWIGLKQAYLPFQRQPRFAGETNFSLGGPRSYLEFFRAWTHFSYFPLHLPFFMGSVFLVSALWSAISVFRNFNQNSLLLTIVSVGFSALFYIVWLFGFYIRQVHSATRNRPHYIVNEQVNIEGH
ncbi:glycosyltransferase [Bdellovibrio sp. HCB185ZH]|uniref:glycosyltransferase n=1 Tax=Bdellovibrio sp. HCB185ZH TaxID=3394235 RepID=UPI0039A6485E